jgi:hypothetical protein
MTARRLAAATLLLAACGVRTRPLPPERVQPEPPSQVVAKAGPEGIHLTWRRPTRYSGGKHMRDLGHFDVERATGGSPFARVATVDVSDQVRFRQEKAFDWTDTAVVAGETYTYRVIAVTLDDYHSAPGGPVTVDYHPAPVPAAPAKRPAR